MKSMFNSRKNDVKLFSEPADMKKKKNLHVYIHICICIHVMAHLQTMIYLAPKS